MTDQIPVPLRDGRGITVAFAVLDTEDAHLAEYRWHIHTDTAGHMYARRNAGTAATMLHREVVGLPPGDPRVVDHINRLTLDNRRANLRIVTHAQNMQNRGYRATDKSSRYRNVAWDKRHGCWRVIVTLAHQSHFLGYFDEEEAAHNAALAWRAAHMPFSQDAQLENPPVLPPRRRRLSRNNTSGVCGVSRRGGKWIAKIDTEGVPRHLGTFDQKEDAIAARLAAERERGPSLRSRLSTYRESGRFD